MLGRKKSVKNEDWRAMHESVSDIISHSHNSIRVKRQSRKSN